MMMQAAGVTMILCHSYGYGYHYSYYCRELHQYTIVNIMLLMMMQAAGVTMILCHSYCYDYYYHDCCCDYHIAVSRPLVLDWFGGIYYST